jgi:hypothetical protein
MRFGALVVAAGAVGDADGSHQRDADLAFAERRQHVAHAAVIDAFVVGLAAVGAMHEDDGVHALDGARQRFATRQFADEALGLRRQSPRPRRIAHQRTHRIAVAQRLLHDPRADAAGGANDQHQTFAHRRASLAATRQTAAEGVEYGCIRQNQESASAAASSSADFFGIDSGLSASVNGWIALPAERAAVARVIFRSLMKVSGRGEIYRTPSRRLSRQTRMNL